MVPSTSVNRPMWLCGAFALSLLVTAIVVAGETDRKYVQSAEGKLPEPIVAVDNVCAWPNLTVLGDGTIVATIHNQPSHLKVPADVECWASKDGGRTWTKRGKPAPRDKDVVIHEPALFHLGKGKWLVAARLNGLNLHTSDDDAKTWAHRMQLTGPSQHPGHLARLKDGSVLLSNGNRLVPKGVDVRFSDDEGATWSGPFRVVDFQGDGGYPSSVQLPDGRVLTAYYASQIAGHNRYHMGVVLWDPVTTRVPKSSSRR